MWANGISDAELCARANINKSAVTDWKKGKTKSYLRHLPEIAEVLGVTENELKYCAMRKENPSDNGDLDEAKMREMYDNYSALSPERRRQLDNYFAFLLSQKDD